MAERDIANSIARYLRKSGWLVRITSQALPVFGGMVGFPDVIAFKANRVLLIEVKTPKGKMRPRQIAFMRQILPQCGENLQWLLAHSKEEVKRHIQELGW